MQKGAVDFDDATTARGARLLKARFVVGEHDDTRNARHYRRCFLAEQH
jgi:hypothetical protein